MVTQMTRAEYERLYGVKPVFSATSTLEDETPAPIRMTRAEYNEIYYPTQTKQDGLGSQLANRAKDVGDALWADKPSDLAPGRTALRIGGAITGAAADVIGAALSPAIGKLVDTVSNIPAVQKFAMKRGTSKALDVANVATEVSQEEWKKFEEKNPVIAQDIRDVTNIASFIPVGKGAQVAGKGVAKATEGLVPKVAKQLDERSVKNVVDEIAKIEDKYAGTRKANLYSKDVDASRRRIAESNVLDGAVDTDGVIRTKTPGGVIDQYRAQTIDGLEDIVRKGLKESKETIPVTMVRQALVREVGKSGLEGADLVTALKKIDKELEGLNIRTKGSSIVDLSYLHDNKIATTKNINYLTPPEKSTYRKAVARAYKMLVEENSTKVDVKGINKELSMYLDDIKRLERLDGTRAEGGRLGKYTASVAGTLIGGAAGSVGGGVGAAVGGIIGGEAAAALKGLGMSRTFKGGGKGLPKSAVLERARLSIPDKAIKAKAGVPKTKEITKLEKDIAKNVADQKKAIKKGDFALVAALKEVYAVLVEELKKAIKYLNENGSVGMSIKKTVTPESVAKRADDADMGVLDYVIRDYDNAILDPNVNRTLSDMGLGKATREERIRFAKDVFDEQAGVGGKVTIKTDPLVEEARGKSLEEFVKAQGTPVYHGTKSNIDIKDLSAQTESRGQYLGNGIYFTKYKEGADFYGGKTLSAIVNEKDFLNISNLKGIERTNKIGSFGTYKQYLKNSNLDDTLANFKKWQKNQQEVADKILNMGYKGVTDGQQHVIFDKSAIKTKSQLEDIWKKANNKPATSGGVKGVPSAEAGLIAEAKKYKSAEEFVADVNQTNISRLKQDQNFSFDVDAADFNQWLWKGVPRSGRKYELVYMSPDEYLNLLRTKSDIGDVPAFPNKDIANLMRGGEKMPVPWLEYDKAGKIIGQEGRNRALAAKELGIKEIPVVSEMPTSATSQLTDIWNKANKADPLVEEARKYKSAEEYIKSKKSKDFWKKRNEEKAKRKLPTKSNNLYHTTPAENLDSIIKDGLVIGKKPRFEGVSSSKKISLSANEDAANYYGGNSDIMIRTKTGYIPQNLESDLLAGGDGVYTTTKNIPPNMLQVKVGGKWYDLTDKQLTDIWNKANRKASATDK